MESKAIKYNYQLSNWYEKKKSLRSVIKQIEQYEGKGVGYRIGESVINKCIVYAVFTAGELVEDRNEFLSMDYSCADVGQNLCHTPKA